MRPLVSAIFENPKLTPLLTGREGGILPALVSGTGAVHRANLAAALYLETNRDIFAVCPDDTTAESFARDLESLTGETAAVLTSRDLVFYSAEGLSRAQEQKRIAALDGLLSGRTRLTVCTASGLVQSAAPPELLRNAAFTIEAGAELDIEDAVRRLILCGYERTEQVEGSGQFSRRGGILDIFSPANEYPVRCEFWGDTVDCMGWFETGSQRRVANVESIRVLPAAEVLPETYPGGKAALADKLVEMSKRLRGDVQKLRDTLAEDADRLRGSTRSFTASDRYLDIMWPKMYTAVDYIPEDALVFLSEPGKTAERARDYRKTVSEDIKELALSGTMRRNPGEYALSWEDAAAELCEYPLVMADSFIKGRYSIEPRSVMGLTAKQLPNYGGSAETAFSDVEAYLKNGYRVVLLSSDERRAGLLSGYFEERGLLAAIDKQLINLPEPGRCVISIGSVSAGFEYTDIKLAVLTDAQIMKGSFRRSVRKKAAARRGSPLSSYADLSTGDLVVHEQYGIGRFMGIFKMPVDGVDKDYVKIAYQGSDILYVPATQLDLVSKYIGAGEDAKAPVKLSKMGGGDWQRAKAKAKGAAKELAKGLIKLYAERANMPGHAFGPDTAWQGEFEDRFGYQETDDQLRCISEIKSDMEKPVPMDRLLCGDVGYGKTEVALRAAMKCVMGGKQAAMLAPTTVLTQQHYQTAMQRFFGYPVKIETLSRFRTPAEIRQTLRGLKSGAVDIVIGTHRLLQKDIEFKDLGLLIVDEEQRFGVSHKERLKEMSRQIDVLALSATPIPRTLSMALSGIRDMSTIEEPPHDRLPVQTYVMEHDWSVVTDAIRREVGRGGQVYYLHNRIENIERVAIRLTDMLEDVTVSVAHGRMDEDELSLVMDKMTAGETDVLVCTTIIETGIDIPNVNTLIIEDADKLGLAQLHQIRGRVGRSSRRAACYLTVRKDKALTEIAEKRLSAVCEFAEFNSGFKIAMRDLEIRGAGNLLGPEQSGHMISVGYDMYLKLLDEAVQEERGEKPPVKTVCSADLMVSASLPENYIKSPEQRMDLYRRIAGIRNVEEADDLTDELIDRFGDPPSCVNELIHVALLRGEAAGIGITDISQKAGALRFVLTEFDMERVSALYSQESFKGRLKVEAGVKPCLRLGLRSKRRVIDEAREFIKAYASI